MSYSINETHKRCRPATHLAHHSHGSVALLRHPAVLPRHRLPHWPPRGVELPRILPWVRLAICRLLAGHHPWVCPWISTWNRLARHGLAARHRSGPIRTVVPATQGRL